jgi:hypothetical protein
MNSGGPAYSFGGNFEGEKIVEARFKKVDDNWVMQISFDGGAWSELRLSGEFAEYLSNPPSSFWTSNLNSKEQAVFAPGERIFLLKRRTPETMELPGVGMASGEASGPAHGVALWIEQ